MPKSPHSTDLHPFESPSSGRQWAFRLLWLGAAFAVGFALFLAALFGGLANQASEIAGHQPWGWVPWLWAGSLAVAATVGLSFYRVQRRLDLTEQQSSHMAQWLDLAADTSGIGMWDWNLKTDQWRAKPTHFRMQGKEPVVGALSGVGWEEEWHPEDRAQIKEIFDQQRRAADGAG